MATVTNYEYLKKLMSQTGRTSIDGTILNLAGKLADVRLAGSSRILEDVQIAEHVQASAGQACSLGIHGGEAFVLAVFQNIRDDSVGYVPKIAVMGMPAVSVRTTRDGYAVSWTYSGPAHHFELYANDTPDGGNPYLVGSFTGNSATVPYSMNCAYFAVRAVALDGTEGPLSVWATDVVPVADPTDLTHAFKPDGHALAWNHTALDDVRYFEVYRNTSAVLDENAVLVGTAPATNPGLYTVPYGEGGDYFGVRAIGWDGTASGDVWTDEQDPTPPDVTGFSTANGNGYVTVAVDLDVDESHVFGAFDHWDLQQADDDAGTNATSLPALTALAASRDIMLASGTTKYYRVRAVSCSGDVSAWTDWDAAVSWGTSAEFPIEDKFDTYARSDFVDVESLYAMPIFGFEPEELASYSWAMGPGCGGSTAHFVEGIQGLKLTSGNEVELSLLPVWNLDVGRFGPDDYVTLDVYTAGETTLYMYLKTHYLPIDNYNYSWVLSAGWNHLKVKKSDFDVMGSPDWSYIQYFLLGCSNSGNDVYIDNLRIAKADPDNPDTYNETGIIWDFLPPQGNGSEWHVIAGKKGGEPNRDCALAQIKTAASPADWFLAWNTLADVSSGVGIAGTYLKSDGVVAFAFCIADPAVATRTLYAIELDTAANAINLVRWVDGVRTLIATKAFTANPGVEYWIGADWRDLDNPGENRIKVYASSVEGNLIQAANLLISATDGNIARGGPVGVMSKEANARFFYVRAGSPQHAMSSEFAFRAAVADEADHAAEADHATTADALAVSPWPAGVTLPFAGSNVPDGWLLCDGATYNQADYPELYTAIGTTWGTGGAGTFNVPDLRDRFVQGASATDALGTTGGVKMQTDVPQHRHQIAGYGGTATATVLNRRTDGKWDNYIYQDTTDTGVAGGVDQRPPFAALNWIIKT
jgi:microcystin-dependent protein